MLFPAWTNHLDDGNLLRCRQALQKIGEEKEDLRIDCEVCQPVLPLSRRRLDQIKLAGPTATQNLLFLPQRWPKQLPVLIAPNYWGMARLRGLEW